MKIFKLALGTFKMDGGASFGVVPKSLWEKKYPADDKNLCVFDLRNLLVVTGDRKIVIDTGIGDKQDERFLRHYHLEGHHSNEKALEALGYSTDDITDVVITHLHFDHVGGALKRDSNGDLCPTFKNATVHVAKTQWDWAMNPNVRERASFLQENILPLEKLGVLNLIESEGELCPGFDIRMFNGHTEGLIVPYLTNKGKTFIYTCDLLPLAPQIAQSWVCGYDTRPLISLDEKSKVLKEAFENGYYLFFQHDFYTEACSLKQGKKGYEIDEVFHWHDLI